MLLGAGLVAAAVSLPLARDGDHPTAAAQNAQPPPVVFLLMDEFPVDALGGPGRSSPGTTTW